MNKLIQCFLQESIGAALTDDELLKYEVPEETAKRFPYYLSGYDYEGAPIWIWELGKWDFVPTITNGGEELEAANKATDQMFLRFRKSGKDAPDQQGFNVIMDMDGYTLSKAVDVRALGVVLGKFRKFGELLKSADLKHGWIVNVNAIFESVLRLGAPLVGNTRANFEVHGTNPAKWKPALLKDLPKDQIPEWYGGEPGFAPVKVYG
ncbi:unnamed protein product [Allacma fusca]|uniref:CRAL-TRIO domain-containing protein n=1 Tax=Allacma fusca TaxID=39272 RepID=A0A8J2IXK5_9HEXA|nr:unnamed protein product [Allacma fusca]